MEYTSCEKSPEIISAFDLSNAPLFGKFIGDPSNAYCVVPCRSCLNSGSPFAFFSPLSFARMEISAMWPFTKYPQSSTWAITPSSAMILSYRLSDDPNVTTAFALVAVVTTSSLHVFGLFSPNSTALSITFPNASVTLGFTSPQMSYSESSRTASGIGTITAISSAVINFLSHACFVVFFCPLSPFTK